jgi:hypothetical protein
MTTADWALVISLCSAGVSLASFVWNVWSKFIYPKPTVQVSFGMMTMMTPAATEARMLQRSENDALGLSATNMGPIEVTLHSVMVGWGFRWWRRRPKHYALLNPLPSFPDYPGQYDEASGPFAGGLPKKLKVGEQFTSYFVPDHQGLAKDEAERIGFSDTFGRHHWAARRDLIKAREHIRQACDKIGKSY